MYVDFEKLPDHARLWIYLAERPLSQEEEKTIDATLREFMNVWAAHGEPLQASFKIVDRHFVVLAVDEHVHKASGCSIDASVHAMKEVSRQTGIDFFNRNLVPFQQAGHDVLLILRSELKQKLATGVWNARTITFNILADTVGAYRTNWTIPAEKSWLSRYLNTVSTGSLAR